MKIHAFFVLSFKDLSEDEKESVRSVFGYNHKSPRYSPYTYSFMFIELLGSAILSDAPKFIRVPADVRNDKIEF